MPIAKLITALLGVFATVSAHAIDKSMEAQLRASMVEACKEEMVPSMKLGKAVSKPFCQCYGKEVSSQMNDELLVEVMVNPAAPGMNAIARKGVATCLARYAPELAENAAKASYTEIATAAPAGMAKTKAGVFAVNAPPFKVMADTEQAYMVTVDGQGGETITCSWVVAPLKEYGSRRLFDEFKQGGSAQARVLLRDDKAEVRRHRETTVRRNPALVTELSGASTAALVAQIVEADKGAFVTGVCLASPKVFAAPEKAKFIEMLATGAPSARIYK